MVYQAVMAWVGSIAIFVTLLLIIRSEQKRGHRFIAVGLRNWLDRTADGFSAWLTKKGEHFVKYIVQLHWYYSIHSVLRMLLRIIVRFYSYFEDMFERNRARAKRLRSEKRQLGELNHLRQMAVHKEDTALTPSQKSKLRHKNLEGKQ